MDEATFEKISEMAKKNGIDPDDLFQAVKADAIPAELQEAVAAVLGDFGSITEKLSSSDQKK